MLLAARWCENRHHAWQSLQVKEAAGRDDAAFIIQACVSSPSMAMVAAADCPAARPSRSVIRICYNVAPNNSFLLTRLSTGQAAAPRAHDDHAGTQLLSRIASREVTQRPVESHDTQVRPLHAIRLVPTR